MSLSSSNSVAAAAVVASAKRDGDALSSDENGAKRVRLESVGSVVSVVSSAPSDAQPGLENMPSAVLVTILQYLPPETIHQDILAIERTSTYFRELLSCDDLWEDIFQSKLDPFYTYGEFEHEPTWREKAYLKHTLGYVHYFQRNADNLQVLLQYLGGADGVRRVIKMMLRRMNPVGDRLEEDKFSMILRGDSVQYLTDMIEGHIVTRLEKAHRITIDTLRTDDGFPELKLRDLRLLDTLTLTGDSSNDLLHCSIAKGCHRCGMDADGWVWPHDDCDDEVILGSQQRTKMVRTLAFKAGIVKMSGDVFPIVATEVLHHMAMVVAQAYEESKVYSRQTITSDASSQTDVRYTNRQVVEKGVGYGTNYLANFPPPFQTDDEGKVKCIIIPRQVKNAAAKRGIRPIMGYGLFSGNWAASDGGDKHEEMEEAEEQYYESNEMEEAGSGSESDYESEEEEYDESCEPSINELLEDV